MTLLVKPIKDGDDVVALGELTPSDTAEIVGPLVVQSDSEFNSTGGIKLPIGTTAERPATPKVGSTRFNTELGWAETWNGTLWLQGSGPAGSNGADGKSAYEIAVANGFVGTEAEWLASLEGADGPTVVSADADNLAILGTDGFIYVPKGAGGGAGSVAVGTTAERPNPPVTGTLRFNTTLDRLEVFGNSFWQILKYDREALAPNIGTATATSNTTADVTFSPSANESIEAVTSYKGVSSPDGVVATKDGAGAGTLNFAGLQQNTRYTFSVCAINPVGEGTFSGTSNEILTFSVPEAPIIGVASLIGTYATVNFTAPAYDGGTPITSYTAVSTPDGLTGTVSQAGSGSVSVTGLRVDVDYTFNVYATNIYGNSPSSAESNSVRPVAYPAKILLLGGGGGGGGSEGNANGGGGGGGGAGGWFFDPAYSLIPMTTYNFGIAGGGGVDGGGGQSDFMGNLAIGGGNGGNGESDSAGGNGGCGGGAPDTSGSVGVGSMGSNGATGGNGGNGSRGRAGGGGGGMGGPAGSMGTPNGPTGQCGQNGAQWTFANRTEYYGGGGAGGNNYGGYTDGGLGGGNGGANMGAGGAGAWSGNGNGGGGGSGVLKVEYISPIQLIQGGAVEQVGSGVDTIWTHTFTSSGSFIA